MWSAVHSELQRPPLYITISRMVCTDWALSICQCTRHYSHCFLCLNSLNPHHSTVGVILLWNPFYRWENWCTEKGCHLSQVTQMARGRVGVWVPERVILPVTWREHSSFPQNTAQGEERWCLFRGHSYSFYFLAFGLSTKWLVLSKMWELKVIVCQRWKCVLFSLNHCKWMNIYWLILGIKEHTKKHHKEEPEILF